MNWCGLWTLLEFIHQIWDIFISILIYISGIMISGGKGCGSYVSLLKPKYLCGVF